MSFSMLDYEQVIRQASDDVNGALRVNLVAGSLSTAGTTPKYSVEIPYSSINGSGGAFYQVVASTSAAISKIVPQEQTGTAIGVYTGAAASETLLCILAPGQDTPVDVVIASGTRITVKATGASAPVAGSLFLTLIG